MKRGIPTGRQLPRSLMSAIGPRPEAGPRPNGAAHVVLPWVHRAFSNLKLWLMGTLHGVRRPHLRRYLDEFTFRWNRRRHAKTAFDTLLSLIVRLPHASMRDFVDQRV